MSATFGSLEIFKAYMHFNYFLLKRLDEEVHKNYNIAFLVRDKAAQDSSNLIGCGYLDLESIIPGRSESDAMRTLLNAAAATVESTLFASL